ncbi:cobalt ABC transporter permease [Vulcanibacillus modesticaldus]|uniref:Energy-coupling factor transporter transmembrane protein EcfT n=1 Tax=Vulcanibacillus modesticaldus TaxID=337097 RepID=A0A1D2YS51_9BACI|nr:energy-coupling factor transporter transmembrane component T [Vulcanibacillus modesticaldus]OEF96449.1 cobalt ABC transporter permease [Vulcanibacillus modesticaldus]
MNLSQYMVIGRYIPGNSYIHLLDARSKLIFVFLYIFLVFLTNSILGYLILLSFIIIGILISKIPISYYVKGIMPIFLIILFTIILHLTTNKAGDLVFQWKWIEIYSQGIEQAVFITLRLLILVIIASMLTLTTSPIDLTMGLERILNPLKRVNLPIHELALMMSISLRFIPTLVDEADKIMKAQKARGANFETGPIHKRVINMIAIIIPLFISAFKRADELAIAMESRGYRGGEGRTRLRVSVFTWRDLLLLLIFSVLLITILSIRGL